MRKPKVKLIALDMDGTLLLSDHKTIHPENIRMIRASQSEGIQVFISTGRLPEDITDFLRRAELHCGMICLNGAVAFSGPLPEGIPESRTTFDEETANRVIDIMMPYGIMINAFEPGQVSTVARDASHRYHLLSRNLIREQRGEAALRESAVRGILKFYAMEEPGTAHIASERMERLRNQLVRECPVVQLTRSSPGIVEVMPPGVGKGQTLSVLAKKRCISMDAVMAVGDEENDLDMLSRSGYSVAMGNASSSVRKACRYITCGNDDAGVAEAIRFAMGNPSGCQLNPGFREF